MIHIKKNKPPKEFVTFKLQNPNFHFDDMPSEVKNILRNSLLKEQGYLCAYCMRRIHNEGDSKAKIEHYNARNSDNELDYKNLLAVCTGNSSGNDLKKQHCDTKKGNIPLHIDPQNIHHIKQISYKSDGTICAKNNPDFEHDINDTLNLNEQYGYLKANRKKALDILKKKLDKFKISTKSKLYNKPACIKFLKESLRFYNTTQNGERAEYCGILIDYSLKMLKKLQK